MITKQDISKLSQIFVTRDEFREFVVEMREFRFKMEAGFRKMDKKYDKLNDAVLTTHSEVMGELQTIRDEQTIGAFRQREHSDQLEKHEIRIIGLEAKTS